MIWPRGLRVLLCAFASSQYPWTRDTKGHRDGVQPRHSSSALLLAGPGEEGRGGEGRERGRVGGRGANKFLAQSN